MELVLFKKKSLYAACKAYGISQSTVRYRLSGKWTRKARKGPPTVLTGDEEQKLVQYLRTMEKKGFPVVKELLLHKVKTFFGTNSRPNPFTNNAPGRKWLEGFLRRHREITFRTPETVSSASSKVKEADIHGWFTNVTSYLEENNLMSAASDATRIYNGDETSFYLHPQTKAVLDSRGNKNVYECEHADGHKNITVMFTFGADGSVVPPGFVLPMQRLSVEVLQKFPGEYWQVWKKVQFPMLYFVDGHSSHTTAEVADLCLDLGIVLIALYPNTTRITQPADVAIFKLLKSAWKTAVSEWRLENGGKNLLLKHFPDVLQKAMNKGIKTASVKNGFRVCGLFPFGPENVDYDKCFAKSTSENPNKPVAQETDKELSTFNAVEVNPELNEEKKGQDVIIKDVVISPTSIIKATIDCIELLEVQSLRKDKSSQRISELAHSD
ncbi:uncharacterized protein LOC129728486 [Wyeomyia smithii]|uniref:uncharacterized protein LOC129728486 n=1 Tax=Wyeomyia smithii TaxID=174621 RepID=UPI002467F63E|nr:uncharacterized protein LOC129728486 [Wyeomyia smithii]